MNLKVHAVLAVCAAITSGAATEASAQCSTSCNTFPNGDQIALSGDWSGADVVRVGRVLGTDNKFYPVACRWTSGIGWVLAGVGPRGYAGGVTVDTSLCTGGGADRVDFAKLKPDMTPETACWAGFTAVILEPLFMDQATFSISGEAGNDWIDASKLLFTTGPVLPANICGGANNDTLFGTFGDDYISGKDGHDYLDGRQGYDNLKADSGNDVLRTLNIASQANDKLRGDTGADCFWLDFPISTASTCGAEIGDHHQALSNVPVPLDCETAVPNCCAATGAACPPGGPE